MADSALTQRSYPVDKPRCELTCHDCGKVFIGNRVRKKCRLCVKGVAASTVEHLRTTKPVSELPELLAKACDDLFDVAWSYITIAELDIQAAHRLRKSYATPGAREMAKELFMMHTLLDLLTQVAGPAMQQIRNGLEAMKTGELAKPIKLTLPRSSYERLRRDLLKSLMNAIQPKDGNGHRQRINLGLAWFASDDDDDVRASRDALNQMKSERTRTD